MGRVFKTLDIKKGQIAEKKAMGLFRFECHPKRHREVGLEKNELKVDSYYATPRNELLFFSLIFS